MTKWYFIIPFYFGKNSYVTRKGGAPVLQKSNYLKQTLDSINKLNVDANIFIYVCDEKGYKEASILHNNVVLINCHPRHLPIESVKTFQTWFAKNGDVSDIVSFNEDDQIINISESVKTDILNTDENLIFSPHRWSRLFFFFRIKHRPIFKLKNTWGVLDNVDRKPDGKILIFNNSYQIQTKRDAAYAANWYMKGRIFKGIDFNVSVDKIELESPSFQVFHTGIPIVKLTLNKKNYIGNFIVDHLSGYDYNRRLFKW